MVKVDKFIFDIDGRKLEFTEEECMALKNKLDELFGQPMIPYIPYVPYIPPIVYEPHRWTDTTITCNNLSIKKG